jgi:hypothetical protein
MGATAVGFIALGASYLYYAVYTFIRFGSPTAKRRADHPSTATMLRRWLCRLLGPFARLYTRRRQRPADKLSR